MDLHEVERVEHAERRGFGDAEVHAFHTPWARTSRKVSTNQRLARFAGRLRALYSRTGREFAERGLDHGLLRAHRAGAGTEPPDRPRHPGSGLAHLLVSKDADHLPLDRQAGIYAWEGIELDRSTLADWVGAAVRLLDPLVDALAKHVLPADQPHDRGGVPGARAVAIRYALTRWVALTR
jgi:hypothetical protein